MNAWPNVVDRLIDRFPAIDDRAQSVQPNVMTLQSEDNALRTLPRRQRSLEFLNCARSLTRGGRIDDAVDCEVGCIADHRIHILFGDFPLATGIESQFLDFPARHCPIGAKPAYQLLPRTWGYRDFQRCQDI
jgi:hypothetical protein